MASGLGTIEYGRALYPFITIPYEFAQSIRSMPDYALIVLQDRPDTYWRMDELVNGDIVDWGPRGKHLVTTGSVGLNSQPLTTNGGSALFGSGGYASINHPSVMIAGREKFGFALETWVRPLTNVTSRRLLLGRVGNGLFITPTGIEFTVGSTTLAYAWDTWLSNHHVVANYNDGQMSLIVNNSVVANDLFTGAMPTDPILYLGGTGETTPSVYLDEAAIYKFPLSYAQISNHYNTGRSLPTYSDVVAGHGGIYYAFDDASCDVGLTFVQKTSGDFYSGTLAGATVDGDSILMPAGSTWTSLPVDLGEVKSAVGARIDWDASSTDILLQYSLDLGTTWTSMTNHNSVPVITGDLTNKIIFFRAYNNTTDVVANHFDNLKFVVFTSKNLKPLNGGSPATGSSGMLPAFYTYNFLNGHIATGANLVAADSLVVPAPVDGILAADFWVRGNAALTGIPFTTTTAWSSARINGVAGTVVANSFPAGLWTHVNLNWSTPYTGNITFAGQPINLAHAGLYVNGLSAPNNNHHYIAGFSREYVALRDRTVSNFTDVAVKVYVPPTQNVLIPV